MKIKPSVYAKIDYKFKSCDEHADYMGPDGYIAGQLWESDMNRMGVYQLVNKKSP